MDLHVASRHFSLASIFYIHHHQEKKIGFREGAVFQD